MFLLLIFEHVYVSWELTFGSKSFFPQQSKKKKKKKLLEVLTDIFYAYIETICLDYVNSLCLTGFFIGTLVLLHSQTVQLTFTCSKSTIETLEKCIKYSKLTIKIPEHVVHVFFLLPLNIFHTFF